MLLGLACLSGTEPHHRLGLQVSRRERKNQTQVNKQYPSTMATRTNSYLSAFIQVLSSLLPCHPAARQHVYSARGCNSTPP